MNNIDNKGFTLIELIIALAVFSVGIMAAFTLALAGLNSSKDNYARIHAVNLAREGLEMIRNERDSNWLKINNNTDCNDIQGGIQICSWNENLSTGYYIVDGDGISSLSIDNLDNINTCSNCGLKYNSTSHLYDHSSYISTNLYRAIEIKDICLVDNNEEEKVETVNNSCNIDTATTIGIEVTSRVYWELLGKEHHIDVKEKLYNWKRL